MRGTRALLLVALTACGSTEPEREAQTFADDAVSLVPPRGWEIKHDRDSLVLVGGSSKTAGRPTIAVRTVSVSAWSEERTMDSVLPGTEKVLRALPGAQVTGPFEVEHPIYPARAFDVTWTPRSKRGRRYQRRHVVVGGQDHLYHVFLTAPEGELDRTRPQLEGVLQSLREDG